MNYVNVFRNHVETVSEHIQWIKQSHGLGEWVGVNFFISLRLCVSPFKHLVDQ